MTIDVDPDWWKSLFDDIYLTTDARSVCDDNVTAREIDILAELIPLESGQQILDLCGGHGRHTLELGRRGFTRCTVLDYSRVLLKTGAQRAKRHRVSPHFVEADARRIPFANRCFHHVMILGNSFGYTEKAGSDSRILSEALRVLKPRGWLALDVVDGENIHARFSPNAWHEIGGDIVVCRQREIRGERVLARELVISKTSGVIRDHTYGMRIYTAGMIQALLIGAGFEDARVHTDFSSIELQQDVGLMNHRMIATARKA